MTAALTNGVVVLYLGCTAEGWTHWAHISMNQYSRSSECWNCSNRVNIWCFLVYMTLYWRSWQGCHFFGTPCTYTVWTFLVYFWLLGVFLPPRSPLRTGLPCLVTTPGYRLLFISMICAVTYINVLSLVYLSFSICFRNGSYVLFSRLLSWKWLWDERREYCMRLWYGLVQRRGHGHTVAPSRMLLVYRLRDPIPRLRVLRRSLHQDNKWCVYDFRCQTKFYNTGEKISI